MEIRVVPAVEAVVEPALRGMLVEAASDAALCNATYLPYNLAYDEVSSWVAGRPGHAWALFEGATPVGWWEIAPVSDTCGFAVPSDTWEREVWLLAEARGRRVVQRATNLLLPSLRELGVEHLLGIAWSENAASIRGMTNDGFVLLGDGWWGSAEDGGLCTVGLKSLSVAS